MTINYINIYNNLITLTRNKELYKGFKVQDTFSDRMIFFLLHFAFFLKIYYLLYLLFLLQIATSIELKETMASIILRTIKKN